MNTIQNDKITFSTQFPIWNLLLKNWFVQVPVYPAMTIGIHESIVLGRLYFWIERFEEQYFKTGAHKDHFHDGFMWVYLTYNEWNNQIPFISKRSIMRAIGKLTKEGYVLKGNFNKKKYDKTCWYRINYQKFNFTHSMGQQGTMLSDQLSSPIPIDNQQINSNNWLAIANPNTSSVSSSSGQCIQGLSSELVQKTEGRLKDICQERIYELEVFDLYVSQYEKVMGCAHPFIKIKQIDQGTKIIRAFMKKWSIELSDMARMMERDLQKAIQYQRTDGNFNSFANLSVLEISYREVES
ncbi:MAG: hypothetical protein WA061_03175 [Microgenomates group bacterium]